MTGIFIYALFFASDILLAQGVAAAPASGALFDFSALLSSWPKIATVFAFGLSVQLFLRALAEFLTRISAMLDDASPSKASLQKAVAMISEIVWFLGAILGKFGYGEPKLVTQEKIEQAKPVEKAAEKPVEKTGV